MINISIIIFILLILISDKISQMPFWIKHICADFPYPDKCWDCKKGSCKGCKITGKSL